MDFEFDLNEIKKQHASTLGKFSDSYKDQDILTSGYLVWMPANEQCGAEIDLDKLSEEQIQHIRQYLLQDEQIIDDSNNERIIWEESYFPERCFIVPGIELTDDLKKELLKAVEMNKKRRADFEKSWDGETWGTNL
jgi:hypothetical protein